MDSMTIGDFADRTRLSAKALRLYDQLGLVVPAHVDPANGYRFYSEDQVERAQLVGLLRRVDMPLGIITQVLGCAPEEAGALVAQFWSQVESVTAERRSLVSYIRARLGGTAMPNFDVQIRRMPERRLLTISRHLLADEADGFFADAFARLRATGTGLEGIAGCPFLVFYGEVSADSDGPVELCRPVTADTSLDPASPMAGVQLRVERAHDEAFIRLAKKDMTWPGMLPALTALVAWAGREGRRPGGALRQVLIADQRTATSDSLVCDLSVPLAGRSDDNRGALTASTASSTGAGGSPPQGEVDD